MHHKPQPPARLASGHGNLCSSLQSTSVFSVMARPGRANYYVAEPTGRPAEYLHDLLQVRNSSGYVPGLVKYSKPFPNARLRLSEFFTTIFKSRAIYEISSHTGDVATYYSQKAFADSPISYAADHVLEVYDLLGQALYAGQTRSILSVIIERGGQRLRGGIPGYPRYRDIESQIPVVSLEEVSPLSDSAPSYYARLARLNNVDATLASLYETGLKIVEFVRASAKLRMQKTARESIKEIVLAVWPEARGLLQDRLPSKSFLLTSRTRFDATMMLTMRHIFDWISRFDRQPMLYIWPDGSPSSGFEAFIIWEQLTGTLFWERLLPVTFLGFGYHGLKSKIFSLLWKFWLETGTVALMRWRLATVKGIISDFGTESDICDSRDLLPEFLAAIGWQEKVTRLEYLFPMAIWSCGWHHQWDHIAQWVSPSPNGNDNEVF